MHAFAHFFLQTNRYSIRFLESLFSERIYTESSILSTIFRWLFYGRNTFNWIVSNTSAQTHISLENFLSKSELDGLCWAMVQLCGQMMQKIIAIGVDKNLFGQPKRLSFHWCKSVQYSNGMHIGTIANSTAVWNSRKIYQFYIEH